VCVCGCVYVCVYVCVCVRACVCVCMWVCVDVCVCMCVCMSVWACGCVLMCVWMCVCVARFIKRINGVLTLGLELLYGCEAQFSKTGVFMHDVSPQRILMSANSHGSKRIY